MNSDLLINRVFEDFYITFMGGKADIARTFNSDDVNISNELEL
ncbi:hypothetical protein N9487_01055 [Cyclobacteriaceae bacterium]|nr:hypothetical protein [Cyclobacteriaceae bacterium]